MRYPPLKFRVMSRMWWKDDDPDECVAAFKYRETAVAFATRHFGVPERARVEARMFWQIEEEEELRERRALCVCGHRPDDHVNGWACDYCGCESWTRDKRGDAEVAP